MARPYQRIDRLKSLFQRELLSIFQSGLNDPILEGQSIQIIDMSIAPDLSQAKVFVSIVNKEQEFAVINTLQSKAAWMRGVLGRKLHIKKVPQFYFIQDDSIAQTTYITALLDKIKNEKS